MQFGCSTCEYSTCHRAVKEHNTLTLAGSTPILFLYVCPTFSLIYQITSLQFRGRQKSQAKPSMDEQYTGKLKEGICSSRHFVLTDGGKLLYRWIFSFRPMAWQTISSWAWCIFVWIYIKRTFTYRMLLCGKCTAIENCTICASTIRRSSMHDCQNGGHSRALHSEGPSFPLLNPRQYIR